MRRARRRAHPLRGLRLGQRDHVVRPALEHRAFARLQGAAALVQRALPLHRLRRARQRQVGPAGQARGLFAREPRGRCAGRHGGDGHRAGDRARPVVRRAGVLRARRAPSRAREGGDPGRCRGGDRPELSLHEPSPFPCSRTTATRAGTSTTAPTGSRTIPTSPSTSSATSAPNRIRPGRSRKALPGPPTPTGHSGASTVEARTVAAAVRCQRGDVSQDPLPAARLSTATTTASSRTRAASWWPS